jgi:hypothetical protein
MGGVGNTTGDGGDCDMADLNGKRETRNPKQDLKEIATAWHVQVRSAFYYSP